MKLEILDEARDDLIDGFRFYESQETGLGSYFLTNLYADIESLQFYAGIHEKAYRHYCRKLAGKFPFAVFYTVERDTVYIHAVVDCRRDPKWIQRRLEP